MPCHDTGVIFATYEPAGDGPDRLVRDRSEPSEEEIERREKSQADGW